MVVWSIENKKKEMRVIFLFNDLLLEAKPMVKKGKKGEPDLNVLKYMHSWNLYHVYPTAIPDTERALTSGFLSQIGSAFLIYECFQETSLAWP